MTGTDDLVARLEARAVALEDPENRTDADEDSANLLRRSASELTKAREEIEHLTLERDSWRASSDAKKKLIAEMEAERAWQPIETAPKDGSLILLYRPLAAKTWDQPVSIKRSSAFDQHCWPDTIPEGRDGKNFTDGACYPTHWMPLPLPPHPTTPETGE